MSTDDVIKVLEIIVPAASSFLGAVTAGLIAIFASIKASDRSYQHSSLLLRQESFKSQVAMSYQEIVRIVTLAIQGNRVFKDSDLTCIGPLTLWIDDETVEILHALMKEKRTTEFLNEASSLIDHIRRIIGAKK